MILRLPHTITVTNPTATADIYGVSRLTFEGVGVTVRASVQPLTSDEQANGVQAAGRVTTRCKAFTLTRIPLAARVTWDGRTWNAVSSLLWSDAYGSDHHWETELQEVAG